MTPGRATASIAIFQFPFSRFRILNQLPWMLLPLTVTGVGSRCPNAVVAA